MTERPEAPTEQDAVLRADPALRRRFLALLVVFALAGALVIVALHRHLSGLVAVSEEEPERAMREVFNLLRISMAAAGIGLLGFAFYFARFSIRALSEGRFPPSGTRVLRDTPVLKGAAARRRALAGLLFAGVALLAGLVMPWVPDLVIRPRLMEAGRVEVPRVAPRPPDSSGANGDVHAREDGQAHPGRLEAGPAPNSARRRVTSS